MANPLYQMLTQGNAAPPYQPLQQGTTASGMWYTNPMQKANYILQAMQNPAAFVKQAFPDIPAAMQNNPNQILQYLQQTRGISNETIQRIANSVPYGMMPGFQQGFGR